MLEELLGVQVKKNVTQLTLGEIRPDSGMFVFIHVGSCQISISM